jgi:hypothetical protein
MEVQRLSLRETFHSTGGALTETKLLSNVICHIGKFRGCCWGGWNSDFRSERSDNGNFSLVNNRGDNMITVKKRN